MDELAAKLHGTTDGTVWAQEFVKLYPMGFSEIPGKEGVVHNEDWMDTVRGWFANAIETGRSAGYQACVASHAKAQEGEKHA